MTKLSAIPLRGSLFDLKGTPRKTSLRLHFNFEELVRPTTTGAGSSSRFGLHAAHRCAGEAATALAVRNALAHAEVLSADTNDGVNSHLPAKL